MGSELDIDTGWGRDQFLEFGHHSKSSLKFKSVSKPDVKKSLKFFVQKNYQKRWYSSQDTKNSINAYLSELTILILIDNSLKKGVFLDDLKLADITPMFKKEDTPKLSTCQHTASFIERFERLLYKQMDSFMENKFSPYLCGFRKNHNAQYLPLKMIENWKKTIRQWWKSSSNLYGPLKNFWHNQSQFTIGKTKSVWFF